MNVKLFAFLISLLKVVNSETNQLVCDYYLAPSAIQGAGSGIYTMKHILTGSPILEPDLNILMHDFLGNKIDPEWNYYSSFWNSEWEDEFMAASYVQMASFPIGAMAQYDPDFNARSANVIFDNAGIDKFTSPGAGAFSYSRRVFEAEVDIEPGEEIYVDYGVDFVGRNEDKIPTKKKLDDIRTELMILSETFPKVITEPKYLQTIKKIVSLYDNATGNSIPNDVKDLFLDEVITNKTQWIIDHGQCLDNIYSDQSTINHAGFGAFAKRFIPKDGFITPIPLLHIKDSDLLNVYNSEQIFVRKQLLLNYCFANENKTKMIFCPTSHGAFINHNSKDKVNAELRWPDTEKHRFYSSLSYDDLSQVQWSVFSFEVVALRDIKPDEEIFIDYGKEWQEAWNNHVQNWNPPKGRYGTTYIHPQYLQKELESEKIRTIYEQQKNPYPENIQTICLYIDDDPDGIPDTYTEYRYTQDEIIPYSELQEILQAGDGFEGAGFKSLTREVAYFYPCQIYEAFKNSYTVRILQNPSEPMNAYTQQNVPLLYLNYPRSGVYFGEKSYAADLFQDNAFRKLIGLPDHLVTPGLLKEEKICVGESCGNSGGGGLGSDKSKKH